MTTKKPNQTARRNFLKTLGGAAAAAQRLAGPRRAARAPRPPAGPAAKYMGDFAAPAIPKVRIAMIGVGARGSGHAAQLASIEGTEIVAISDLYEDLAKRSEQRVVAKGHKPKLYFGDPNHYRTMLTEVKPDMVVIATPWEEHAPMGVAAMRAGAHAFIETPIAVTMDEMWQLVDTSEETGRHCMHMENVCYGREELLYLNMVRQGRHRRTAARRGRLHPRPARPDEGGGARHGLVADVPLHQAQREPLSVPRPRPRGAVHEPGAHRGHVRPPDVLLLAVTGARALREGELPRPTTSGTRRRSSPATSTRRSSRRRSAARSWSSGTSSRRGRTRAST